MLENMYRRKSEQAEDFINNIIVVKENKETPI